MRVLSPRLSVFFVAALPYVLLPYALAWSVAPLARAGARLCKNVIPDLSLASGSFRDGGEVREEREQAADRAETDDPSPEARGATPTGDARSVSPHSRTTGNRGSAPRNTSSKLSAMARRALPSLFVGPKSIQLAIPVSGRPVSAWTDSTGEHPAGLLIQSPGALRGVIEAGDILVEAEGQPLSSFEHLVATVRQAYERRAARLSGRVFRRGDLVGLTVEPGW